ncbi:MAG: carbamoyl-phosphate synthase, partial [Myxococcales bacterium]
MTSQGEALLTAADYNGTLSAARSLGRAGVRVVVADPDPLARTCWSRHAARTERCPDASAEPEAFLSFLLDHGRKAPGTVLYATSDDVAFVISRHRDELARWFRMYSPPFRTVYALLNKWQLYQACVEVGIDAPHTWLPASEDEVSRLAREASFP